MANSVHRKSSGIFILSAIILTPLLTSQLMGCAAFRRSEKASPEEQKIQSLENEVKMLSGKLADMQTQLTITREQLTLAQASQQNEQLVGGHAPGGKTAVIPHPADGAGISVEASKSDFDPEAGFLEDGPVKSYRKALILFKGQKYSEAIMGMSTFLDQYADHALAGFAQFYIGESYYKKSEFKLAKEELERLLSAYDRNAMVPFALARLIEIEESLKDFRSAESHKQMLLSMYPSSPAALDIHYQEPKPQKPGARLVPATRSEPAAAAPIVNGVDMPPQSADIEKIDRPTPPESPVVEGLDAVPNQEAAPSHH